MLKKTAKCKSFLKLFNYKLFDDICHERVFAWQLFGLYQI